MSHNVQHFKEKTETNAKKIEKRVEKLQIRSYISNYQPRSIFKFPNRSNLKRTKEDQRTIMENQQLLKTWMLLLVLCCRMNYTTGSLEACTFICKHNFTVCLNEGGNYKSLFKCAMDMNQCNTRCFNRRIGILKLRLKALKKTEKKVVAL